MALLGGSSIRMDSEVRILSIAYLSCSRDMKSCVSSIGTERERERENTNIFNKIIQNKNCQYFCSQNVQKYRRPMNHLPKVGSLKLTSMGVFTSQKSADATTEDHSPTVC